MTVTVTLVLLLSAVVHASWNAMVKATDDRLVMLAAIFGTIGIVAWAAIPFLPPMTAQAWVWMGPAVLIHVLYKFGILAMYRHGDLSLSYPVARGVAPIAVVLLAMALADELPTSAQVAGILVICAGLMGFLGREARANTKALLAAALTGIAIAAYTVVDGLGVRASDSMLSFAAWMFALDASITVTIAALIRRGALLPACRNVLKLAAPGGIIAASAYLLVLWALGQTSMGGVSAIRESSVVFAALIGTLFLGEPMGLRRILSSVVVLAGIVILNLGF